jgi:exo-beta-1,3-glucanase (GH17 family)
MIMPEAQIRTDLTAIAAYAKSVRTYTSAQGLNAFR